MKHIIAVVGMSGSGKTTMTQHIEKVLGIPSIVSFTTRPMREGEVNGVEHWFVDEDAMPPRTDMLAYAYFGGYHYWTKHDQIPDDLPCTYIIDEKALDQMIDSFGDQYQISPVYVQRSQTDLAEIDEARRLRDRERPTGLLHRYEAVILNTGSLEQFLEASVKLFKELYGDYGSTKK